MSNADRLRATRLSDSWWHEALDADVCASEHLPAGLEEVPAATIRLTALLEAWAIGFAIQREDVVGPDLTLGSRGLHPDECASFLRALDAGHLHVDSAGYVTPVAARPKPVGGRYALCCKSGAGVTINTEYIIQLGAVGELVSAWAWAAQDLQVEMTEFDIVGFGPGDNVVLAVEAKARVTGPDSLEKLLRRLLVLGEASPPEPVANAERKYLQLLRFCEAHPVVLWLIAAGARWSFVANRADDRVHLRPIANPGRQEVLAITAPT